MRKLPFIFTYASFSLGTARLQSSFHQGTAGLGACLERGFAVLATTRRLLVKRLKFSWTLSDEESLSCASNILLKDFHSVL